MGCIGGTAQNSALDDRKVASTTMASSAAAATPPLAFRVVGVTIADGLKRQASCRTSGKPAPAMRMDQAPSAIPRAGEVDDTMMVASKRKLTLLGSQSLPPLFETKSGAIKRGALARFLPASAGDVQVSVSAIEVP